MRYFLGKMYCILGLNKDVAFSPRSMNPFYLPDYYCLHQEVL